MILGTARFLSIPASLLLLILVATPVSAGCFGSNTGAGRAYYPSSNTKGYKTIVDLQDRQPATGTAIAHPAQVAKPGCSTNCDFFGFGTFRGGPVGGLCGTYTSSTLWRVYVDGNRFGVYMCSGVGTVASAAQNQIFIIRYTSCAPGDTLMWVFTLNSTQKGCWTNSFTASDINAAGGESAGPGSQDVDIFYQDNYYLDTSSVFRTWSGVLNQNVFDCADPGYRVRTIAFPFQFWTEKP